MKKLRIGFIGVGPRALGLIKTTCTLADVEVTALCDRFEPLALKGREAANNAHLPIYTDHRKMLREAAVDAVMVIVEPYYAAPLSIEALEAGKHVYSEVPMSYRLGEIWDLVLAVEKSGLKYQMGEQVRYMPFVQAWKDLHDQGTLGKIVHGEGQYLHGMDEDRYFQDPVTGARLTLAQARAHTNPKASRCWVQEHPIYYLPHELSPLLRVLDDRVVSVVAMGSRPQSYLYEWFPRADIEVALMHTAKDTVLRLSCGFTLHHISKKTTGRHWYALMGVKGCVETHRANCDKMKLFLNHGSDRGEPQEMDWDYDRSKLPAEALASGHGGSDYWPIRYFVDAVRKDQTPEMDVYKAAEASAPSLVAGVSIERGCQHLRVPDFRPGPQRRAGTSPLSQELEQITAPPPALATPSFR